MPLICLSENSHHLASVNIAISKRVHAETPSVDGSTLSASNRGKLGTDLEIGPVDLTDGAKEEKVKDPNIVDWDGPDDPENPLNWTSKRKITATCSIALITFLTYVCSSHI